MEDDDSSSTPNLLPDELTTSSSPRITQGANAKMLPKVASNILHLNLSRVVVVQTHAAQLRTVLQFQPSYPSSALPPTPLQPNSLLASHHNNPHDDSHHGHGSGGSRAHTGSRFYQGYTGPGRAVTQANTIANYGDTSLPLIEEPEELEISITRVGSRDTIALLPFQSRVRAHDEPQRRRNSLALGNIGPGRVERARTFGILDAVQVHLRAKHTFASAPLRPSPLRQEHSPPTVETPRQDSTLASPASLSHPLSELPPSLLPSGSDIVLDTSLPVSPAQSLASLDGSSSIPASPSLLPQRSPASLKWQARLNKAKESRKLPDLREVVAELRSSQDASVAHRFNFNQALGALLQTHTTGAPIVEILELYNHMVVNGIHPNIRTYSLVIQALCRRDREIYNMMHYAEGSQTWTPKSLKPCDVAPAVLQELKNENNLASALALFHAGVVGQNGQFDVGICNDLLRSCAIHKDVDAAVRVFAHIESVGQFKFTPLSYAYLLNVYNSVGDLSAAEEIFEDFKRGSAEAIASLPSEAELSELQTTGAWDRMIEAYFIAGKSEKAIELVEQMLNAQEPWIPQPHGMTYTNVLRGFLDSGDLASAMSWFDQLVTLASKSTTGSTRFPTIGCYGDVLRALAEANEVDQFIRVFNILREQLGPVDAHVIVAQRASLVELIRRNLKDVVPEDPRVDRWLASLKNVFQPSTSPSSTFETINNLDYHPANYTGLEAAIALMVTYARFDMAAAIINQVAVAPRSSAITTHPFDLSADQRTAYTAIFNHIITQLRTDKVLEEKISLGQLLDMASVKVDGALSAKPLLSKASDVFVEVYRRARTEQDVQAIVKDEQWTLLVNAFAHHLQSFPEFVEEYTELMADFSNAVGTRSVLDAQDTNLVVAALLSSDFEESIAMKVLQPLGSQALEQYAEKAAASKAAHAEHIFAPANPEVHIDIGLTRAIDEWSRRNSTVSALDSFVKFEAAANNGFYPTIDCVARLVIGLVRAGGTFDQVKVLYSAAQLILATLESDRQWQAQGWFQVENAMVTACAMLGDLNSANLHRGRIIEQGGAPSADSYAALVVASKESTDDASIARSLFDESQRLGVVANPYLYNTVISKLSRARKADEALELFGQMKRSGVFPNSVTYGALIGACARVGDEVSALYLFEEMHTQRNYKPRVPPFNTMIQLYVNVKPDREKALAFYNKMLTAGVRPTGHTYKLLLDVYGSIEPVDASAMERVFEAMAKDHSASINGTHWASLINSWGCVTKDLNRAVDIFESIATHPSTARSPTPLPDAVVYEALINVLVSHHRMDLVSTYVQRLIDSNVHMTAYVANVLIRGYAASGDLESARNVFETLADPPSGLAAVNNHAAHETEQPLLVSAEAPVYREPSSWEAMVRAELGAGDRDRAQMLLERMESRHYPEGVVQRIRSVVNGEPSVHSSPDTQSLCSESTA